MPGVGELRPGTAEKAAGEVDVWVASLDVAPGPLEAFRRTLAPEEEQAAARLGSARDRGRFIARRGLRRAILARYAGCAPASLRFETTTAGKPELAGGGDLRFSSSHSGGLSLHAVARGRRVGVDVERLRPVGGALAIARSLFAPVEAAGLAAVPAGHRDEAFLRSWTRKEACLKASGEGLGGGLDRFTVSLAAPQGPADPEAVDGPTGRWWVSGFTPTPGYAAAVAAEGTGWRARCRPW